MVSTRTSRGLDRHPRQPPAAARHARPDRAAALQVGVRRRPLRAGRGLPAGLRQPRAAARRRDLRGRRAQLGRPRGAPAARRGRAREAPRRAPRSGAPPSATSAATRPSWSSRRGPSDGARPRPAAHGPARARPALFGLARAAAPSRSCAYEMPFAGAGRDRLLRRAVPARRRAVRGVRRRAHRPPVAHRVRRRGGRRPDRPHAARGAPHPRPADGGAHATAWSRSRTCSDRARRAGRAAAGSAAAGPSASRCSTPRCCAGVAAGPAPAPEVAWTLRAAGRGRRPARDRPGSRPRSAGAAGHLAARWRRDVGMGAEGGRAVLRFQRALRLLRDGRALADVAYDCGFADQPHLNREFRALGGSTPGEVTNLQDVAPPPL